MSQGTKDCSTHQARLEKGSDLELISHAPDCLYVIPLRAHLGSELLHVGIDGSGISEIVIVPHIIEDLLTGKCDSLVLNEIYQKFIFLETKLPLRPVDLYGMGDLSISMPPMLMTSS